MKRSRSIALISMGLGSLALSACGQGNAAKPEAGAFRSAKQCAKAGTYTLEQCQAFRADAISRHDEEFPSYDSLEQCEKVVGAGRCEPAPFAQDGTLYRPKFRAFIIADGKGIPVYPSSENSKEYRRGMALIVWRGGSMASPATMPKTAFAQSKPSTTSRGGFGSTGQSTGSASS